MTVASPSTNSLTFDSLSNSIGAITQTIESNLQTIISSMQDNPTTENLLAMQTAVQKWTMFLDVQSTIVKDMADAMKGIIQKAS